MADPKTETPDLETELSFPASDVPASTPPTGLRMDTAAFRSGPARSMAIRALFVSGLQSAYQSDAAEIAWLAGTEALTEAGALQGMAGRLADLGRRRLARAAGLLTEAGMPRDGGVPHARLPDVAMMQAIAPGKLRDLALALAMQAGQQGVHAMAVALHGMAAGMGRPDEAAALAESLQEGEAALAALAAIVPGLAAAAAAEAHPVLGSALMATLFSAGARAEP